MGRCPSAVATGGGGNLPPSQPPIEHPVRSMQIPGDFQVGKIGVGLQDLLPRFAYTHGRRKGGRRGRVPRSRKISGARLPRNYDISEYFC